MGGRVGIESEFQVDTKLRVEAFGGRAGGESIRLFAHLHVRHAEKELAVGGLGNQFADLIGGELHHTRVFGVAPTRHGVGLTTRSLTVRLEDAMAAAAMVVKGWRARVGNMG